MDANRRWSAYLSAADFVVGGVPRTPGAPIRLALAFPPSLRAAIGSREALERDDYVVVAGRNEAAPETVTATLRPAAQGLWDMGADFHWGYARALFSIEALQADVFSLLGEDRTAAWSRAFEALDAAREAFAGSHYRVALDALDRVLEGDESSPGYVLEWRVHLLRALLRLGFAGGNHHLIDLGEAERSFALAARYSRDEARHVSVQALTAAAWAASRQGGLARAAGYLRAAEQIDPALPETTFLRAGVAIAAGRDGEALDLLARSFALDRGYCLRLGEAVAEAEDLAQWEAFLRNLAHQTWQRGIDPVARCLDRLTFWRQQGAKAQPGSPADADLARLDAYITDGESWPIYDVLQLLAERDEITARLLAAADGRRIVVTEERPGPQISRIEQLTYAEPVREKVITKAKTLFSREQFEWRATTRTVVKTAKINHQLRRRATTIYDGTGRILAELDMIGLPLGSFTMGSPATEFGRSQSEAAHQTTLTRPFFIGVIPVTQGLWEVVMGDRCSFFEGDDLPAEQASWMDATAFCNALSRLEGLPEAYLLDEHRARWPDPTVRGYRLPTEAEWEYAARAGTTTAWSSGEELDDDHANFGRRRGAVTTPAGVFPPNPWGVCDVHGNVWEWCWDAATPYPAEAVTDPVADGADEARVARGGSWASDAGSCRSASRASFSPWHRQNTIGFRLAIAAPRTIDGGG